MIGLFVISVTLQLLAVIIWAIEHFTGKQFSELFGCTSDEEKAPVTHDHFSNLVYSSGISGSQEYGHHWTTTGATAPMAAKEMGVVHEPPPFEAPLFPSREGPRLRPSPHALYPRQSPETMAQYASAGPAAMAFPHGMS